MSVAVKICGLSEPVTLDAALAAGADFVGLVFYPPSPRNVGLDRAEALADRARGRARIVALTVDADDDLIAALAARIRPDYIQCHGAESPQCVAAVTARTGIPVIKAIKVADAADVEAARAYAGHAAMILFDARAPESLAGALPGGNGLAFDWTLLSADGVPARFMLSGGLDAASVARAVAVTGAPIVDVSSGVERAPGVKDAGLIRKFVEAAKAAG